MSKPVVISLLLFVACAGSAPRPATPCTPVSGPFLWQVAGGKQPLYFFGTVHAGGRALIPEIAFTKLRESSAFAAEIDLDALSPMKMLERARLPEGQDLESLIGADRFAVLAKHTEGTMPAFLLRTFKPWFALSVLLISLVEDREALDPVLLTEARRQGKRLVFFETIDQQLGILEQAMTAKELSEAVDGYDEMKRLVGDLLGAYRRGDHAALAMVAFDTRYSSERELEFMLYARNDAWVPVAEKMLAEGGGFAAVGSAHLVGPRSVLASLAKRGHLVRRLAADGSFVAEECR
jgi:uncharacterized protein